MSTNDVTRRPDQVALRAFKRPRTSGAVSFEAWVCMNLGTWLFTKLHGELVGTDAEGNRYHQDKRVLPGRRRKRWVMYNGVVEASRIPPEWHAWLHHTTGVVPPPGGLPRKAWQKDHEPNLTGTDHAYRPPGHTLVVGDKPKPPYETWRPG